VALLMPASSPGSTSSSSTCMPSRSAHRRYIRRSMSAQSWESMPPAPACRDAMASFASYRPESRLASSTRSSSASMLESLSSSSLRSSGSSSSLKSSSAARKSSSCRSSRAWRSTTSFRRDSRVVRRWPRAGSSHTPGSESSRASFDASAPLASTSKVLLRAGDPAAQVFDPLGVLAHRRPQTYAVSP